MTRLCLLIVPLLALGCSSGALNPGRATLERQVTELQERVLELQRKAAVNEVELARLRRQMSELDGGRVARVSKEEPLLEPVAERPATSQPVAIAGGQGAVSEAELDDPESPPVRAFRPDAPLPAPGSSRPAGESTRRYVVSEDGTASATAGSPAVTVPAESQALYDRGYTLYHQKRYEDAEDSLSRFLEAGAETDLADNALYWIGESRLARGDLEGALEAFASTVEQHPEGNKVPDALLKAGQVLEQVGDTGAARDSYRQVQRRFPESAAAVVASKRLKSLG